MKNLTESCEKPLHKNLISCIENLDESVDEEFLNFILEQIVLKSTACNRRRYSAQLYSYAYVWRSSSTACYKLLSETFCLPSIKTLNRLSSAVPSSEANKDYLKVRCQHLSAEERVCILLIDEVYTAEKIELNASGQMVGLTSAGEPAKTVLAFMVKSLRSKFSEMIALVPVRKLTGEELKSHFYDVLELLKDVLLIQAVSTDNHAINRKLYSLLRSDTNACFVDHPNHGLKTGSCVPPVTIGHVRHVLELTSVTIVSRKLSRNYEDGNFKDHLQSAYNLLFGIINMPVLHTLRSFRILKVLE